MRNHHQPTLLEQLEATNAGGGHVPEENHNLRGALEESLRKELAHIKKKQDQHAKAVQKLRNSFRFKEGLIKEEQLKIQNLIKDLLTS